MNAKEFIKRYKEKEFLPPINYKGDLMISERQIEMMLEDYAKHKALNIAEVSNQRELLIAFGKFIEDKYWDNKGLYDAVDVFLNNKSNL